MHQSCLAKRVCQARIVEDGWDGQSRTGWCFAGKNKHGAGKKRPVFCSFVVYSV